MSAEHTLGRLAEESWTRFGDVDSLYYEGTWHRAEALAGRARRAAGGFGAFGIGPGDRVVVMMATCPEVPIVYQALWSAGAVVTPVVFLVGVEELRHIVSDSGAAAVVTSPELLGTVRAAAGETPVVVVGDAPAGTTPFSEIEAARERGAVARDPADLAALMYTGGTTGRAKGVMLTHGGLWHVARAAQEMSHLPGVNRAIVPVPLSHAYGLIVTIAGMHAVEPQQAVLMRWFDPKAFLDLAAGQLVQYGAVVPSMLQMLLAEPLEETELPELRYLTCGAAPLGREVLEEFERRVPGVQILEGYGLTETSAVTTFNPPGRRKVGSVGLPLPGYTITVRDDDGEELEIGDVGEVCVRGEALMRGYWTGDPEEAAPDTAPVPSSTALVGDELYTGDIGCLDDDGYLHIVDRKKDLIIRGGFNVFPRDVEDALNEHRDVLMSGVVGRPDPVHGEEVVAFVQLRPGATATAEELIDWARVRVGRVKYPRELHFTDSIPVTSILKLDRKALRARLGIPGSGPPPP
ncbi:AMP-binding protein [Planomonospora venezuelensis]|uniref:Long-chain acyl-CoA synthetase n=1 Tax=Planomonospora venezuelensis TaxID=1999 RepID=A0A841DAW7_PLAVE|nr:AMP-binding protein [Planomonospora venezuelensis]MBB5965265.1 long-chain acyl-CoA synthetase [Planomonospora venezuelensis]GIN00501.1 long-chain-fatty-acid--CoA ligase [Planomonospora venezuelensis]